MGNSAKSDPLITVEALIEDYTQGRRNFADIILNESKLIGLNLSQINLRGAQLNVTNLSSANLSNSDLSRAQLNVSRLSGANLTQADLSYASLNVANLILAILVGVNLNHASLIRAELVRADLSNATLRHLIANEADLREVRLRWSDLTEANLSRANLRSSSLIGAVLERANLHSATLSRADLSGAVLQQAELRHALLDRANLSGTNLRGANLRWADLTGATLREADLSEAKLSGANLMRANLSGADLLNTSLVHADLTGANLTHTNCVGADFTGANLTGAKLYGASRFHLKTAELICEWIDLSPEGDGSQLRQFDSPESIQRFFSQAPSRVQVVIDSPLTPAANLALATAYHHLAEALPSFPSASIDLGLRKTTLTLQTPRDTDLMQLAYAAVLPFTEASAVQKSLMLMLRSLQACGVDQLGQVGTQVSAEAGRLFLDTTRHLSPLPQTDPFFEMPLQLQVFNANGDGLEVYHSARFGIRSPQGANSLFPAQPRQPFTPGLSAILDFFRQLTLLEGAPA